MSRVAYHQVRCDVVLIRLLTASPSLLMRQLVVGAEFAIAHRRSHRRISSHPASPLATPFATKVPTTAGFATPLATPIITAAFATPLATPIVTAAFPFAFLCLLESHLDCRSETLRNVAIEISNYPL